MELEESDIEDAVNLRVKRVELDVVATSQFLDGKEDMEDAKLKATLEGWGEEHSKEVREPAPEATDTVGEGGSGFHRKGSMLEVTSREVFRFHPDSAAKEEPG